ncbi:uncharacterized protein GIQ15_00835 [Arthroderma uncinatum]|uniref:uncharacterized protein n=1 Tax=Arthroderma uncinatum TaxID=74035 RepID=UPI00144AC5A4|nr:uncharacterized protein GIQ15_00835 [Arthroderma uncinatum]KAF3491318.1 hypothetical protein GIQ15_00835 [Arthroderma uncinatum]
MAYANIASAAPPQPHSAQGTLTLQILKFSYTTTSADRATPLAWTYLSGGSDLLASFPTVRVRDESSKWTRESRLLNVMKGREVLEEVDLGLLAQKGSSNAGGDAKAPVAIIVKSVLKEARCQITEPPVTIPPSSYTTTAPGSGYGGTDCQNVPPTPESVITSTCYYADGPGTRPVSSAFAETRPSSMESSITLPNLPNARPSSSLVSSRPSFQQPQQAQARIQAQDTTRPSTAPTFLTTDSLSQFLPPRRELPFAKAKKRPAQQSPQGSPSPKKVDNLGQGRDNQQHARPVGADIVTRTPNIVTPLVESSLQQAIHEKVREKVSENGRELGGGIPRTLLPSPSISPQKKGGGQYTIENNTITITDTEASASENINSNRRNEKSPPFTREDLASYASLPSAERSDLIESWVCQQLQSDSFITLCQDMEGVWKRVAFGL